MLLGQKARMLRLGTAGPRLSMPSTTMRLIDVFPARAGGAVYHIDIALSQALYNANFINSTLV